MARDVLAGGSTSTLTLERVNTPPAQTWNYLRANDITLTVPAISRKGDVYFALPRLFEAVECGMGDKVSAWVESQSADAQYVEVRPGEKREEPIVASMDTGVMVRAGAEATVVVCAASEERVAQDGGPDHLATTAALVRIICERGSHVRVFEFVAAGDDQQHLESVGIVAEEDAHVEVRQFFLGAKTCAAGLACALNGNRSRIDLTTRYLARGHEQLDLNHVVRQRGRATRADIRESGVLDDHAHKSLRATIDLVHGSSGSQGAELESVLVLSDDVVNKTMPTILCDEDDVAGNHGATIGSVDPEQIQYLADRGLTHKEAEALYVRALFDDALICAPTAEARATVLTQAQKVLGPEIANDLLEGMEL